MTGGGEALDYDQTAMPQAYDQARGYSPEVMELWLGRILAVVPAQEVSDIVDLGCGTGRFSVELARAIGARLTGLDPSEKMLAEARRKPSDAQVVFRRAKAEALPLEDASQDLVFLSMVLHHLGDRDAAARECHRVLRPGGRVCLRNSLADEIESYPQIRFFPGYRAALERQLIPRAALIALFRAAGFAPEHQETVAHPMAASWPDLADKLQSRADSFLAGLPDADFEAGMAALRAQAAREPTAGPVTLNVDLLIFGRA